MDILKDLEIGLQLNILQVTSSKSVAFRLQAYLAIPENILRNVFKQSVSLQTEIVLQLDD